MHLIIGVFVGSPAIASIFSFLMFVFIFQHRDIICMKRAMKLHMESEMKVYVFFNTK